MIYFKCGPG